jgi:hypothetical protein
VLQLIELHKSTRQINQFIQQKKILQIQIINSKISKNQLLQLWYQHHQLQVFILKNSLYHHHPSKNKQLFQLPLSPIQAMLLQ